jgi:dTDP-4-amino-4,6-dideoxygalactose transaminase
MPPAHDGFLVFGEPAIGEEEIAEVVATLRSGWIGTGPRVARFEEQFRSYQTAEHAIAVGSCTAALHLSVIAAGIGPGDEVILPGLTFCATANAVLHAGAVPVLADSDPDTMNLDVEDVASKTTARTRAIIPVHFAGRPCEMDPLCELAASRDLKIIEDCAHAVETRYRGRPAGTFGDFGCFSFYATKNVTTGEGGMILTRREEDAARVKVLALHGMSKDAWKRFGDDGYKHYQVVERGFKYNMMDLQAAMGIHQLRRVERNWERRRDIWARYQEAFGDLPLRLPTEPAADTRHAYHLYTVLVDEANTGFSRDSFLDQLRHESIGAGVHYVALPEHPYYQDTLGWTPDDCPEAVRIGRQTVSLPLSPRLSDEDVQSVIDAVHTIIRRSSVTT